MDFKAFWLSMSRMQRAAFAKAVGRSPGYLQLVAGGFRRAGPELATKIQITSFGAVTREEMRQDIYGDPAARKVG